MAIYLKLLMYTVSHKKQITLEKREPKTTILLKDTVLNHQLNNIKKKQNCFEFLLKLLPIFNL
jgi:hypothetical protein